MPALNIDPKDPDVAVRLNEGMTLEDIAYLRSGGAEGPSASAAPDPGAAAPAPAAAPAKPSEPGAPAPAASPAPQSPPAGAAPNGQDPDDEELDAAKNPTVPYQRFYREQQRRKTLTSELRARDDRLNQLQSQLSEQTQKYARVDERLRLLSEAVAPQPGEPAKPATPPDPEADPFAYMRWLGSRVEQIGGTVGKVTEQTAEEREYNALASTFAADAQALVRGDPAKPGSAVPDFVNAYNYLWASRDKELELAGQRDAKQRQALIKEDERAVVKNAIETNRRPAEVIYELAKMRGYVRPAAPNGAGNGAAAPAPAANGAAAPAAAPAPAAPAAPSVVAEVERLRSGQAASKSLSSGGGAPVPQGIDLEAIAAMDDAQYASWRRSLSPAQLRELQGLLGAH